MIEISENDLHGYETMWTTNGPVADRKTPFQYRKIPGRRLGEEISLYNSHPRRPDWSYTITFDEKELCCNGHFRSAHGALTAAYEWLKTMTANRIIGLAETIELSVRSCSRGVKDEVFTVDGLPPGVEVTIRNFAEGNDSPDWGYQVKMTDDPQYPSWVRDHYVSADDALNAFNLSDRFIAIQASSPIGFSRPLVY